MSSDDRLTLLLAQKTLTGIDFVRVANEAQTLLHVYLYVDPDELDPPDLCDPVVGIKTSQVQIVSTSGGERLAEVRIAQDIVCVSGDANRQVLQIEVEEPGDLSLYQLTIEHPRFDRFFNSVTFSFKQDCESLIDCKPGPHECPPEELVDFPVDYLARDFDSFRSALLDFAAQRYPQWSEKIEADMGVMLMELMAALGDEFSYIQDRYAREAYLPTATQRRSLRRHTRLVDYTIHDGHSASTFLALTVNASVDLQTVYAGNRVRSPEVDGQGSIPFEIGQGLADRRVEPDGIPRQYNVHSAWNEMPVHIPDPGDPCLPVGTTELYLDGHFSNSNEWIDRWMVLRNAPDDPSIPLRRHLVQIVEVEEFTDPLMSVAITRIRWSSGQALPFELCQKTLTVLGNVVPAVAGETFDELFVIGAGAAGTEAEAIEPAVEREGPLNDLTQERGVTFLYSLKQTEAGRLGWLGPLHEAIPEVELEELSVNPGTGATESYAPRRLWNWRRSLLDSTSVSDDFTLDDGTWRRIIGFRSVGGVYEHVDYASGNGSTIRFGDGEFGKIPADGTVFRVRYRTGPGTRANLPRVMVTQIEPPLSDVTSEATNPLAITSGVDPQDLENVRQIAPEAFRAITYRAVRREDYREIAERLGWVQRANARTRWTGSWLSTFVTADPEGSFKLSDSRARELFNVMDEVRQAGREVCVLDPEYIALDLVIWICIEPFAYPSQVRARVIESLVGRASGRRAFFDPDNFTFGTPLRRAQLEAAIQAIPGVKGVGSMSIRARGITDWRPFTELNFKEIGPNQVLRLQNDPRYPERGSLQIETDGGHSE